MSWSYHSYDRQCSKPVNRLDISNNEVKIAFEFELRMWFQGVALIKDKPKELKS